MKGNVALKTSKEPIDELSSEDFLIDLIHRGFKVQEIILSEYQEQDVFEVRLSKRNTKPVDWVRKMILKVVA